ncbi:MAG: type II toxin-antitoxin system RelE/ParE family toxin [Gammaproteobacteria bacterium]|nr:type II toxin-antitoxin system RelE/ParE family toxin [Gammaproteobacteria bacterium]
MSGTYEWVVKRTPYLITYTVNDDQLIILRVIHGKQCWPETIT